MSVTGEVCLDWKPNYQLKTTINMEKISLKYLGKELRKKLAAITGKSKAADLVPEFPIDPASRILVRMEYPSYIEKQIMDLDKHEIEKRKHYEMYDFLMHRKT